MPCVTFGLTWTQYNLYFAANVIRSRIELYSTPLLLQLKHCKTCFHFSRCYINLSRARKNFESNRTIALSRFWRFFCDMFVTQSWYLSTSENIRCRFLPRLCQLLKIKWKIAFFRREYGYFDTKWMTNCDKAVNSYFVNLVPRAFSLPVYTPNSC